MTPVDPALLTRIAGSLRADLAPVRPLPSTAALVARLLAIFVVVALAAGVIFGFYGVRRLDPGLSALIFCEIVALTALAAVASVHAIVPGSRRLLAPSTLAIAGCALLASLFALIFRDHSLGRFVPQGLACFRIGMLCAIPTGFAAWIALRRGMAVDRRAAGVAIGMLAGLAGLTALELHCPNFRLAHVAIWHLGVVAVSAAAGYFLGPKRTAGELRR